MRDKRVTKGLFALFVLLLLAYGLYTARNLILGPEIVLGGGEVISVQSQIVDIAGSVRNSAELTLNGRTVPLLPDGSFSERVLLQRGDNVFEFESRDRFGRTVHKTLRVRYTPQADAEILVPRAATGTTGQ